ncbi:MAG: pyridoxal 5'-phosphate synthase glutaminase subunit PdxT [Thermoplasmata archaeon]|nr:pyridoxal 5'-phosphate synthase glutaminase subunit PdxT [Thermoplasmata archaeon]
MKVGVLALQGDVPEHRLALAELLPPESIGLVRAPPDLEGLDAMLMPGGESTTIAQLLATSGLWEPLGRRLHEGLPVLATCAGLILVSQRLVPGAGGRDPPTLGLLDVLVGRNEYGGQVDSFEAPLEVDGEPGGPFPGVFIRAPKIVSFGPGAEPFVRMGSEVVGVRSATVWGLTFHPELSGDPRLLAGFLSAARERGAHSRSTHARSTTSRATPTSAAQK